MPKPPRIVHGDCLEVMKMLPNDSVDSIVTDPPYGLGFMGKAWDALPPGEEWAAECLRVLTPGGHLLAFGGTRTWHRLAVAVEDAGFEIRDSIAWMYGSGFPKHRAALKPAFEPVVMARKPFKGSLTANEATHGTGALDVDGCRIGATEGDDLLRARIGGFSDSPIYGTGITRMSTAPSGRWPANVALDEHTAAVLDRQSGYLHGSGNKSDVGTGADIGYGASSYEVAYQGRANRDYGSAGGGASRFFYVAKAPKKEHCIAIEREAEYLPLIQARIDRQDAA